MMKRTPARFDHKAKGQRNNSKRKTLGPVLDLQSHLRPDWWKSLFGSLYLKTDGDVVDDQQITNAEINRICDLVQPQLWEEILDLCCGQGRHSLELARRGFRNIHGLDRSRYLIRKARSLAASEGLDVRFREGDARKLPYQTDSFDVVLILGNSFGYFENPSEDEMVLKEIFRVLKPSGRILMDVADGDYVKQNYEPRSWEWINQEMLVCRERMLNSQENRLICREVVTHAQEGILADQIYAERLYTSQELLDLTKSAGFQEAVVHDEKQRIEPSQSQDPGMMAQRLFLTGSAIKDWTPSRRKVKKELACVAVVLGDHRKSDPVKPNNAFDDDDFYTINELKSALGTIPDRKFLFLDNHEKLLGDLTRLRARIDYVFNLCDEGYDNDPRKELHVPALLEILGIPYTGSGPQCLATCYDKSMVRGIAGEMGIAVPYAFLVLPDSRAIEIPVPYPVIVKPNFGDSSFGIFADSVVEDEESLLDAINRLRNQFGYDKPILVEEFLPGKDLTIGIIGQTNGSSQALPMTEEDYSALPPELPRICGYEAKWDPDSPYWKIKTVPADLPPDVEETIASWSLMLAERLECRDYVRFDWRLDSNGKPKLLEANPNPGWCWDGHMAKAAELVGMSYADMIHRILTATEERIGINNGEVTRHPEPKVKAGTSQ
jgi:D-alanine-D-alanine ligase